MARTKEQKAATRSAYVAKNRAKFNEWNRKQRYKDIEKFRAYARAQSRSWVIRKKFGLTLEQYEALLFSQSNCCAVCKAPDAGTSKNWRIDHCHATGKVRGLLCHNCNVSLGLMKDSIESIRSMLAYLIKHQQEITT